MPLASTLASFRCTLPSYVNLTNYGLIQCGRDKFHLKLKPKAPALAVEMTKMTDAHWQYELQHLKDE